MSNSYQKPLYFKHKGLTYQDVTRSTIDLLHTMLRRLVEQAAANGDTTISTLRIHPNIDDFYTYDGTLVNATLYVDSHYFTRRALITFHKGGYIEYAGWMDEINTKVIAEVFAKWVDTTVANKKAFAKKLRTGDPS